MASGSSQRRRPAVHRPRGGREAVWLGSLFLVACTSFEPGTDELPSEQVAQLNQGPGRDWTCLPEVVSAPAPYVTNPAGARRVVQSVQFLSLVTQDTIPGISVRACAQRDVECLEPLTEAYAVGADGWVDLPLYEGFDGYLEVTGESLVPTALFYANPLTAAQELYETPIGLVELSVLRSLAGAVGVEAAPDQGLVVLRALDCQGQDAADVRYSIDRPGSPWYFLGGLPSNTLTQTADSSLGGFVNVQPGIAVVSARLEPLMRPIAPPTSILVRGGWMTGLRWLPQP